MVSVSQTKHLHAQAAGWIILCRAAFIGMMALVKFLPYQTLQVNLCRSVINMAIVLLVLAYQRKLHFKSKQPKLQLVRVICGAFGMMCYYYAFRNLDMAKASTLLFAQALILPVLAMIFLHEKSGWRRILAVVIGYIGIWVALDPVYEEFSYAEGIALLAAALGAGAMVSGKKLTATDNTLLLMFFSGLATVSLLAPLFVFDISLFGMIEKVHWQPMLLDDWKYILLIVLCSLTAQYSHIRSYKIGDIGFLAPFEYLKFIFSLVIGYLFFAEFPETTTYIGAAIVMGSTLYLTKRELKKNPQYNYRPDR
tara:strand:- start:11606 stop:12532 length:927 start_codon:yes stop_codon:yes gene_type:complete